MAYVWTTTGYVDLDGELSTVEGVKITGSKCGHSEESFGADDPSLSRCAYLLRKNCPRGERNDDDVNP
jgi:hypothetical protein